MANFGLFDMSPLYGHGVKVENPGGQSGITSLFSGLLSGIEAGKTWKAERAADKAAKGTSSALGELKKAGLLPAGLDTSAPPRQTGGFLQNFSKAVLGAPAQQALEGNPLLRLQMQNAELGARETLLQMRGQELTNKLREQQLTARSQDQDTIAEMLAGVGGDPEKLANMTPPRQLQSPEGRLYWNSLQRMGAKAYYNEARKGYESNQTKAAADILLNLEEDVAILDQNGQFVGYDQNRIRELAPKLPKNTLDATRKLISDRAHVDRINNLIFRIRSKLEESKKKTAVGGVAIIPPELKPMIEMLKDLEAEREALMLVPKSGGIGTGVSGPPALQEFNFTPDGGLVPAR